MRFNRLFAPLWPRLAIYPLPLVFVLITSGVLFSFRESASPAVIAMTYLAPVTLSAVWWGLGPGVMAAVTAFLAFNYLFIEPYYTFSVHSSGDWVMLIVFLAAAILISELVGRARTSLENASARELETFHLYELSGQLAAAQDETRASQVLAQKVLDALEAAQVEVFIDTTPPSEVRVSQGLPPRNPRPNHIVPIETARGLLGEVRIWGLGETNPPERFLKTSATQMALTLERIRLAGTAQKTKILEENDRFKSSLLSSVSHELRSPLAAIQASVSSLRAGEVEWESAARTELLQTVEEEIDHLNMLVGNLLDMSRIESGSLKPAKKPNLLGEIIGTATRRMRQQLQNHRLTVDVSDELPLVSVDYVQMEQVFINLLSNSLKYSPPGSNISITAQVKDERWLLVRVTNQSMPLPEADLGRIFDKFYRINPSERVTGSGLGLSICKGIIEAHGGTIWAENVTHGVAFNFTVARV